MNQLRRTNVARLAVASLMVFFVACGAQKKARTELDSANDVALNPFDPPSAKAGGNTNAECALTPAYFAYDSSDLDGAARDSLARSARCVQDRSLTRLKLVGMTDPRGTEEYNLALGERRAGACRKYLLGLGLPALMQVSSVGEEMAKGSEEQGWAGDRKAYIEVAE